MVKQIVFLILLSAVVVFFRQELAQLLDIIVFIHNIIAKGLHLIFSDDTLGHLIQDVISLLIIPIIVGLLVSIPFWLTRRAPMPNVMGLIWILWLVLLTTMLAQTHIVPNNKQSITATG